MGKKLSKPGEESDNNVDGSSSPINTKSPSSKSNSPAPDSTTADDYPEYASKLTVDDFDLLKVLGKGSFGKVMLVKKKDDPNGTLYAMKTLRKSALAKRNQLAHTSTERVILQKISSPFLVHLEYAFQTPDKLYMVIDYMGGGELFFWLKRDKRFSEPRARLYAAQIACGLGALHSADIIYRDLKPENILCGEDIEDVKIADFGLSKMVLPDEKMQGACGTLSYVAPEVLAMQGYGVQADVWSIGVILFLILCGKLPFDGNDQNDIIRKTVQCEPLANPAVWGKLTKDAKDFLLSMLHKNPTKRITARACLKHDWIVNNCTPANHGNH
eukprot:TRINITY_DN65963_c5_g3_i5.p1 TRINITY_DN65963_c5_g3~~TRINITY_DN65963_c5_g3_i5.p1  ORF type:complete len:328 (+),score=6.33 TRINITY_DN65963_c5_g3_i5:57-1040(+)